MNIGISPEFLAYKRRKWHFWYTQKVSRPYNQFFLQSGDFWFSQMTTNQICFRKGCTLDYLDGSPRFGFRAIGNHLSAPPPPAKTRDNFTYSVQWAVLLLCTWNCVRPSFLLSNNMICLSCLSKKSRRRFLAKRGDMIFSLPVAKYFMPSLLTSGMQGYFGIRVAEE